MRDDRGQSSLEYVGLAALVAVVLGAAVWTGAPGAGDLGRVVTRELARALCILRDGDCHRDRTPCVVRSRQSRDGWSATLGFVKLGASWVGLVEQRSDGRWVVTRTRADSYGLTAGAGVKGAISAKGLALRVGGEARARALVGDGDALSWTLPTEAAARALLRKLRPDRVASVSGSGLLRGIIDRTVDLPEPDRRRAAVTHEVSGTVSGELTAGDAGGSLEASAGAKVERVRSAGGGTTTYVTLEGSVAGALSGLAGTGEGELVVAVARDRSGRAVDLSLVQVTELGGSEDLPADLSEVAGRLAGDARALGAGGRRRVSEVERHLDLTRPEHRRAAAALMAALRGGRPDVAVARALDLRRRLVEAGTAEARTYELEDVQVGAEALARAGAGLGGELFHERMSSRLVGALSRGLDGRWISRDDCLAVV